MMIDTAIVGSGNIGTDLMIKLLRSEILRPTWMIGIESDSEGLRRARELGLKTTSKGIDGFLAQSAKEDVKIAFDATSASAHLENNRKLQDNGIWVIDLTPAAIGPYCIPAINLESCLLSPGKNVNMVTCGGQATIPIVAAVSGVQPVEYAEIVATISSRSAGPGTRRNIDEFTTTTARGIEELGGAKRGKAIIILNPAEPPLIMRDTIHCITKTDPDVPAIEQSVRRMVDVVQQYVPGFRLVNGPVFDGRRVSTYLEVEGLGDFLPNYSGNLDIMTAAATRTGEIIAESLADEHRGVTL